MHNQVFLSVTENYYNLLIEKRARRANKNSYRDKKMIIYIYRVVNTNPQRKELKKKKYTRKP